MGPINAVNMVNIIEGVIVTQLKQIAHPKGDVYHAMKCVDSGFIAFGEAYFSTIYGGLIKAWETSFSYDSQPCLRSWKNTFCVI